MDLIAEFRRHADECRRMARATVNVDDSTSWSRMAQRWSRCAEVAEQEERVLAGARTERHRAPRLAGRPQQAA
jgi:hypothetical protein